jgi:hypothetical protein
LVGAEADIASPFQSDATAAPSAWLLGISQIPLLLSRFAEKVF